MVSGLRARASRVGRVVPILLMPPAEFGVHQLRYYLAYGPAAVGFELQRTGHSYLHSVLPWLVALIALCVGGFLWSLGRAFSGHLTVQRYARSLLVLWLLCTAGLIATFSAQEFLEGLFATGHPAGLVGIFGFGGWWAIPVAACFGLVLATLFHGGLWVLEKVAASRCRRTRKARRSWHFLPLPAQVAVLLPPAPLIDGWSGRGPPRTSFTDAHLAGSR